MPVTRVLALTVLALAVLGLPAGSASGRVAGHPRLRTFRDQGVTFQYPYSWRAYEFLWSSSFQSSLAYVSNVPLHFPCVGRPLGASCTGPVASLPRDGALVIWTENGWPGWTFARARGRPLQIHGVRARLQTLVPQRAWCPRFTARMLDIVIERKDVPDNWYEMRACLTGPHLPEVQRTVMDIVMSFREASVRKP